jgi:hypothetical protein
MVTWKYLLLKSKKKQIWTFTIYYDKGCTNPSRQVAQATRLCSVAPNICQSSSVWSLIIISMEVDYHQYRSWLSSVWKLIIISMEVDYHQYGSWLSSAWKLIIISMDLDYHQYGAWLSSVWKLIIISMEVDYHQYGTWLSSVWNLIYVAVLSPRIVRWLLDFWEICGPLDYVCYCIWKFVCGKFIGGPCPSLGQAAVSKPVRAYTSHGVLLVLWQPLHCTFHEVTFSLPVLSH